MAVIYPPCPLLKQEGNLISHLPDKEGVGVVGYNQDGQQVRLYLSNRTNHA